METWPIATSGYVAASFTEFTSRADDPQLHTHVVVANKVKGIDGVWRTVDGRLLYRHQLAAGYLHEAVLRKELTERLGVRWQPVRNGMADIEGFTRSQIEAFSRRRDQLETWRQEQGLPDTPAARQVAVLATRQPETGSSPRRTRSRMETASRRGGSDLRTAQPSHGSKPGCDTGRSTIAIRQSCLTRWAYRACLLFRTGRGGQGDRRSAPEWWQP